MTGAGITKVSLDTRPIPAYIGSTLELFFTRVKETNPMRNLLCSLTFAFVLLLAGSASLATFDEPGTGGTVPAGEHQVWLPVVGRGLTWHEEYYQCPYLAHPISPPDHAIVSGGEPLTITFSYEFDNHPSAGPLEWVIVIPDTDYRFRINYEIPYPNPITTVVSVNKLPPPGTYTWYVIAVCWGNFPAPRSSEHTITFEPTGQ